MAKTSMPSGRDKPRKKVKRSADTADGAGDPVRPVVGRTFTVSVGVPGSVIENTQTMEHAYFVAGQIARTAAVFNVDEVVVFDDTESPNDGTVSKGAAFLARILQYMETPQYLRKALIPMHPDLRLAGLLPPLDAPHHMRATEWAPWREGAVMEATQGGVLVDIGLQEPAFVAHDIPLKTRLTLSVGESAKKIQVAGKTVIEADVAAPNDPTVYGGLYWGYSTRLASGVNELISGCPYDGGYDLKLGTSEHGTKSDPHELELPGFTHLLIAFGGPPGLEDCLEKDSKLWEAKPTEVFDMYLNTCPEQGSRTIRTEEAMLITMSWFQTPIKANSR